MKKVIDPEMEQFQADLIQSIREMKAGKAARTTQVKIPEIIEARHRVGLSQSVFAKLLGVSVRTLQQ